MIDPKKLRGYKFFLHPGQVKSVTDKQWHSIGYAQLIECYHLPPFLCIDNDTYLRKRGRSGYPDNAIHLFPLDNGKYLETLKAELLKKREELKKGKLNDS